MRLLLLAGLAAQPIGWFVPPWVTTGQPFLAATHAADYNGHLGSDVLRSVVTRGIRDQVLPALIAGDRRGRDRLVARPQPGDPGASAPASSPGGWSWSARRSTAIPGWSASSCPAAALTCVLGGVGIARLAQLAGEPSPARLRRPLTAGGRGWCWSRSAIPFSTAQISEARADESDATRRSDLLDSAHPGGGRGRRPRRGVLPCKTSFAAVNHSAQTALAWKLQVTLSGSAPSMRAPGRGLHRPAQRRRSAAPAKVDPRLTREQTLAGVGPWRVVRLTDPRLPHCTRLRRALSGARAARRSSPASSPGRPCRSSWPCPSCASWALAWRLIVSFW